MWHCVTVRGSSRLAFRHSATAHNTRTFNRNIVRKVSEIQNVFHISLQLLFQIFCAPVNILQAKLNIRAQAHTDPSLHKSESYRSPIWIKNCTCLKTSAKLPKIWFHKNYFSGTPVAIRGKVDDRTYDDINRHVFVTSRCDRVEI